MCDQAAGHEGDISAHDGSFFQKLKERDPEVWNSAYRLLKEMFSRHSRFRSNPDLLHESLVRFMEKLAGDENFKIADFNHFKNWLFTTGLNIIIDEGRKATQVRYKYPDVLKNKPDFIKENFRSLSLQPSLEAQSRMFDQLLKGIENGWFDSPMIEGNYRNDLKETIQKREALRAEFKSMLGYAGEHLRESKIKEGTIRDAKSVKGENIQPDECVEISHIAGNIISIMNMLTDRDLFVRCCLQEMRISDYAREMGKTQKRLYLTLEKDIDKFHELLMERYGGNQGMEELRPLIKTALLELRNNFQP